MKRTPNELQEAESMLDSMINEFSGDPDLKEAYDILEEGKHKLQIALKKKYSEFNWENF